MLKRLDTWLEISEKYNTAYPVTPTSPTNSLLELQNEGSMIFFLKNYLLI